MYEYTYPDYSTPGGKLYVDITDTFYKKVQAISTYKSWVRQFPHPCSPMAAQIVAEMRGLAIQANYAEMFHVVQMIGE
jgi:LmbE family N-acetylglucosaminyl deacetylase